MAEVKKTRESWDMKETNFFLRLMYERKILKSLDGKRFRAEEVFKHLVPKMEENGYLKTARQMQTKFRTLREMYNTVLKVVNTSGECTSARKKFRYFEAMNLLLSERPVQSQLEEENGIDSTDTMQDPSNDGLSNASSEILQYMELVSENVTTTTSIETDNATPTTSIDTEDSLSARTPVSSRRVRGPPKKRTYQQTLEYYAEVTKRNYMEAQNQYLLQQEIVLNRAIQTQQEFEERMLHTMLAKQQSMLQETTTTLMCGLQSTFQQTHLYTQRNAFTMPFSSQPNVPYQATVKPPPPTFTFQRASVEEGETNTTELFIQSQN